MQRILRGGKSAAAKASLSQAARFQIASDCLAAHSRSYAAAARSVPGSKVFSDMRSPYADILTCLGDQKYTVSTLWSDLHIEVSFTKHQVFQINSAQA